VKDVVEAMKNVPALVLVCLLPIGGASAGCYGSANGVQHRFVLSGADAFDRETGLTWKRCSLGAVWDGKGGCAGEMEFVSLDAATQTAKAAGADWHVPSGPELESIIDTGCGTPVVDAKVFPDIRADDDDVAEYWTTNTVGAANLFYFFDFMTGTADGHSRGFRLAVRLVKAKR
jgi:hypothetical protein